jgi:GH24 family phage-related lysozyme (muramidase)
VRDSVRDAWIGFTEPIEGGVACLYNDVRGLTTIAYGNLCNTPGEAAALPLVHPDGTFATTAEKIAAWRAVHDDPNATHYGWRYAARLTPLRLTREGMSGLALAKLETNDRILLARLPEWESYVACAQMGMHSLAWACGANAHFPRLFQAVTDRDFDRAAVEIYMNEMTPEGVKNAGLVPRNVANKILMRNAARVEAFHLDPDLLDWVHDLSVTDAPTLPALDNPASSPTIHPSPSLYLGNEPPDDDVA